MDQQGIGIQGMLYSGMGPSLQLLHISPAFAQNSGDDQLRARSVQDIPRHSQVIHAATFQIDHLLRKKQQPSHTYDHGE